MRSDPTSVGLDARLGQGGPAAGHQGSEAENEKVPCLAHLVSWETSEGSERLATSPCTGVGTDFNLLLQPDWPKGKSTVSFCAIHTARYLQERNPSKCSMSGCTCIGSTTNQGVNFCEAHAADLRDAATTRRTSAARTRRQRSRSRTRPSRVTYDQDGDGYQEDEEEPEMDVDEEHDEPGESSQGLLDRIKDTHTTPKRVAARPSSRSPGHTPKSSIQRNLAKIGMLNSPGSEGGPTFLQDFVETLAEGKGMGMDEKKVRQFLANKSYALRRLITEAEVEQARGQKGLTKFLTRWREELREGHHRRKSTGTDSEWNLISDRCRARRLQSVR